MVQTERVATVLCICLVPAVAETQRLLLEQQGYRVFLATNFHEIEEIARQTPLDCALVGADIEPKMKRAIAAMLQDKFPATAILEVCRFSPEIEGVAYVLAESPDDILGAVNDLLLPHGRRHTEFLQRRSTLARQRAQEMVEQTRRAREHTRLLGAKPRSRKKQHES